MTNLNNIQTYTASEARKQFYSLVKKAGDGLHAFEITARGSEPVVLINKAELESWLETLDIINSEEEISAIRKAKLETTAVSHEELMKQLP